MPRNGLCGLLILIGLLVLAPAADAAAPKVTGLSAPGAVAQDGRLTLTVKLRNASRKATKRGTLTVLLSADRKRDRRDLRAGTVRIPSVPARRTKAVQSTLTIAAKPGGYHLLVRGGACKTARLTVTAKPVPAPGGV